MSGWVDHFKLSADPFSDDPRTWQYYYGAEYGPASLRLEHALDAKQGYIAVTGPAGTGKSALVRSVLRRARVYASATVSVSERAPVSVIDALLVDREPFDGEFSATRKRATLLEMLDQARRCGKPIVCVIEDAHLANSGQLRELVEAINVAPDAPEILQVLLVGRDELDGALQSRTVAALSTRITTRIHTGRLKDEELAEYLLDRLEHREIENPSAILPRSATTAIARHSRGVIALAEVLTRAAMERAADAGARTVTTDHIDEAAKIYARPPVEEHANWARRAPGSVSAAFSSGPAVALVVLALLVAGAQINMIDGTAVAQRSSDNRTQMAQMADVGNLVRLSPLPESRKKSYEPRTPVQLAQATAESSELRQKFLEGTPYEAQIQPPQRPANTATEQAQASPASPGSPPVTTSIQKTVSEVKKNPTPNQVPRVMGNVPPAAPAAPSPSPMARPSAQTGTRFALQVGAFRELRSAVALKGRLAGNFSNVYVSTVESGGEPLYRVRVGSFASREETTPMKMQLQASGHPSFTVSDAK